MNVLNGTDNTETLIIMFPAWGDFVAAQGRVGAGLTMVKKNYQYDPNTAPAKKIHTCTASTYELVACQNPTTGESCNANDWTVVSTFIDNTNKRVSLDLRRPFSPTENRTRQMIYTPGSSYKLVMNWANFTLAPCSDNTNCTFTD